MNTIAKRIVTPYKKNDLNTETIDLCGQVEQSLKALQKFIAKMKSITILRETLGTALTIPVSTRWLSQLSMVSEFFKGSVKIKEALTAYREQLLSDFNRFSQDHGLIAFQKMLEPVKGRVKFLEVKKFGMLKLKISGRKLCDRFKFCNCICYFVGSVE